MSFLWPLCEKWTWKFLTTFAVFGCISNQDKCSVVIRRKLGLSHWSQFSLMKFKAFLFPQKGNRVFFWTLPFYLCLLLLLNCTVLILLHEEKKSLYGRWFAFMRKNRHIMTSCTRNLARAPSHWVRNTAGALRHLRLETKLN